ncbi:MAG: hypothetical protein QF664_08440 [Dehalococcoidia bacterium]|jgi:hypothetical protein|nr:hypothetical protein [Dehalococcoidia bacterium]
MEGDAGLAGGHCVVARAFWSRGRKVFARRCVSCVAKLQVGQAKQRHAILVALVEFEDVTSQLLRVGIPTVINRGVGVVEHGIDASLDAVTWHDGRSDGWVKGAGVEIARASTNEITGTDRDALARHKPLRGYPQVTGRSRRSGS